MLLLKIWIPFILFKWPVFAFFFLLCKLLGFLFILCVLWFLMIYLEFVPFINSFNVRFFQPGKFIYFSYGKNFLNYFFLCYKLIDHSCMFFSHFSSCNWFLVSRSCSQKKILDMISVLLNLLRLVLWPSIWSTVESTPYVLEKHVYSTIWVWNICSYPLSPVGLLCHLKALFPYWFSVLNDRYI